MRSLPPALLALALVGCGGPATPELYAVVIDHFRAPASCYDSGEQPKSGTTVAPPALIQVEVWDGPDDTAVLQVQSGTINADMGDAPNVSVGGVFKGTKGNDGWTFSSGRTSVIATGATTVTETAGATFSFPREPTFTGTATLTSARTCDGTGCPTKLPSCTISGISLSGTQLQVEYLKTP